MKTYFYWVSYIKQDQTKDKIIGDCIIDTSDPIATKDDISRVKRTIDGGEGITVVILGFTLLRVEESTT